MTDADVGFTPDFGIFANSMVNVTNTDLTDGRGSAFGLGFANGPEQTAKAMSERDGQSYEYGYSTTRDAHSLVVLDVNGNVNTLGAVTGFVENGMEVNMASSSGRKIVSIFGKL